MDHTCVCLRVSLPSRAWNFQGGWPLGISEKSPAPYPFQNVDKHIVSFCLRDIVCPYKHGFDMVWPQSRKCCLRPVVASNARPRRCEKTAIKKLQNNGKNMRDTLLPDSERCLRPRVVSDAHSLDWLAATRLASCGEDGWGTETAGIYLGRGTPRGWKGWWSVYE